MESAHRLWLVPQGGDLRGCVLDIGGDLGQDRRMKTPTLLTLVVVGLVMSLPARAADQATGSEIKASDAASHIGETGKVTGKVESAHQADGGSIFLDLDGRHPNNPFTVFIPSKSADKFSKYADYEGKTITVSGKIAEHDKKPQIIVSDPAQIVTK
jgi:hypothetical protein